jgi:hypothetical protein
VFLVFVSKVISTQNSINLLDCNQLHISLLCYILTWPYFEDPKLEKSLLEISRLNLSTEYGGILKMHFGELKLLIIPTDTNQIVCYIRNDFECLEVSKLCLHLKYELHSGSSYLLQKLSETKFLPTYSTVVGYI